MAESIRHKTGVFGGTFDPVHIGHLFIARAAYEALGLEKVIFIPTGKTIHKRNRIGASDEERVEMLELALASEPDYDIDPIEIEAEEYSFSYRTMQRLAEMHPENEYYFLIGEDSLRDLSSWRCPEELVKHCHIAVAGRMGYSDIPVEELMEKQRQTIGGDYVFVECPYIDISSSEIRKRVSEGKTIRYYTPDDVIEYIRNKKLYVQ